MNLKISGQLFNWRSSIYWETFEVEILSGDFFHETESLQSKLSCSFTFLESFCKLKTTVDFAEVIYGSLGALRLFKANEAECFWSFVHFTAGDRAKDFKHLFQLFVSCVFGWEVLDENVGELISSLGSFS